MHPPLLLTKPLFLHVDLRLFDRKISQQQTARLQPTCYLPNQLRLFLAREMDD
jgi:hypothetical protein